MSLESGWRLDRSHAISCAGVIAEGVAMALAGVVAGGAWAGMC